MPPTVKITTRLFGREQSPIMFGWLMCTHQIGGASAAFLAGTLRMELGTYGPKAREKSARDRFAKLNRK